MPLDLRRPLEERRSFDGSRIHCGFLVEGGQIQFRASTNAECIGLGVIVLMRW